MSKHRKQKKAHHQRKAGTDSANHNSDSRIDSGTQMVVSKEGNPPPPERGYIIITYRKEIIKMKRILFLATVASIIITASAGYPVYMRIITGILGAALLVAAVISYRRAKEQ